MKKDRESDVHKRHSLPISVFAYCPTSQCQRRQVSAWLGALSWDGPSRYYRFTPLSADPVPVIPCVAGRHVCCQTDLARSCLLLSNPRGPAGQAVQDLQAPNDGSSL